MKWQSHQQYSFGVILHTREIDRHDTYTDFSRWNGENKCRTQILSAVGTHSDNFTFHSTIRYNATQ